MLDTFSVPYYTTGCVNTTLYEAKCQNVLFQNSVLKATAILINTVISPFNIVPTKKSIE